MRAGLCVVPRNKFMLRLFLKTYTGYKLRTGSILKFYFLTYRALNDLAPEYIKELVHCYRPAKDLRSGKLLQLAVPTTRLKTFGDRCFEAAAPKEWNKLPMYIKLSPSITSFKSNIKTHLFKLRYEV